MNAGSRILLVEDSATQAVHMSHLFETQGWTVACAGSAEEALDALNRERPDVIVADQHLPGMRGDEMCRRVRMNVNTREIPILMLTADTADNAELRSLDSGADDYVSKSLEEDVLLLRVQALLRKCRAQEAILGPGDAYFRQARVLVIDDSPTYLLSVAEALREEDFNVETASGGAEGVSRVHAEPFDCVIVDLMMPEMDGIEVCRHLTELRRSMDSPIVVLMLTASENKEDMTRGLDAGADDFVGKSNDIAVLKARIRALLRRKFFQEENHRIIEELKNKELEAVRARAAKEAAEARAALVEQVEAANRGLEAANRKLRETQAQLVHSEKMASLGQLVAGIAHEMNNPLGFVIGNVHTIGIAIERVVGPLEDSLDDAAARRLDKIRRRTVETREGLDRLKDLVQKLRTFSRLDAGVFSSIDITESVDTALKFLRHKIKDRIEIRTEFGPDRVLKCYAGELNQLILNLVANAVDALDESGRIDIRTGLEGSEFVIRVRDDGPGIPEEIRGRIFDPFFTTKPVGQGMGLGLSLAYGIAEAHHGRIEVDSEPGAGTEFRIAIPTDLEERIAA